MTNREQRAREVLRLHAKNLTAFGEANVVRAMLAFSDAERSAQSEPGDGWVLVPREPTEAMLEAAGGKSFDPSRWDDPLIEPGKIWSEMLAAAPIPAQRDDLPSDGTCWQCGSCPRDPATGLCATCTDAPTPPQQSAPASDVLREALDDLQKAEAAYRKAHDLHGDADRYTGRMWDLMRRAGDKARTALSQPSPSQGEEGRP